MKIECSYCGENIPDDRYTEQRYKLGIMKGYCCPECKHRAGTLRMAVIHPKKYTPKHLNKIDKKYMQNYVNELHLSRNELK